MATTGNRAKPQNSTGNVSQVRSGALKKNIDSPIPSRIDNRGGGAPTSPNVRPSPPRQKGGRGGYRKWSPAAYDYILYVKKQAPSFSENEIFQLLVEKNFDAEVVISALQDKKKTFWSNIVKEGILPTDAPASTSPSQPNGSVAKDNNKTQNHNPGKPKQATKRRNPNNNGPKSQPASSEPSSNATQPNSNRPIAAEATSVPVKAQPPPKDKLTLFEEALMSVEQSKERALNALKELIEDYKTKIGSLNEKKKGIEGEKEKLFKKISLLDEDIAAVDKEIEGVEKELAILNARVKQKVEEQN
eukprot:TRINITY_DN182_c0_g3_i1.p1 TRINITY_DN182_c0_g3~~TRINITY_DN182_c0_g3_i1.p1  ORF type:complete len:302 (-),score=87.61 TRINITY_DN182_c0_g3_i1:113-1018(-)